MTPERKHKGQEAGGLRPRTLSLCPCGAPSGQSVPTRRAGLRMCVGVARGPCPKPGRRVSAQEGGGRGEGQQTAGAPPPTPSLTLLCHPHREGFLSPNQGGLKVKTSQGPHGPGRPGAPGPARGPLVRGPQVPWAMLWAERA